jgi:hypothetical protein
VSTPLGRGGRGGKLPFLLEGGQMGELIAAHDWAVTPIGALSPGPRGAGPQF